jgi:hypothetical protein
MNCNPALSEGCQANVFLFMNFRWDCHTSIVTHTAPARFRGPSRYLPELCDCFRVTGDSGSEHNRQPLHRMQATGSSLEGPLSKHSRTVNSVAFAHHHGSDARAPDKAVSSTASSLMAARHPRGRRPQP